MRFYLACVTSFALMVIVLRSCSGGEYMSVPQASFHHGKGGEAHRKQLRRHQRYYAWISAHRCLKCALSAAAVPTPHAEQRDTAGTIVEQKWRRFDTATEEPGRTPQQIIDDAFINIGWQ